MKYDPRLHMALFPVSLITIRQESRIMLRVLVSNSIICLSYLQALLVTTGGYLMVGVDQRDCSSFAPY